jgi:hypothetical protein
MDAEIAGHVAFDHVEEAAELARAMARHAFADNGPGLDVECGKQRCHAMLFVIMGTPFDLSRTHRQERLGAIQRLDL